MIELTSEDEATLSSARAPVGQAITTTDATNAASTARGMLASRLHGMRQSSSHWKVSTSATVDSGAV